MSEDRYSVPVDDLRLARDEAASMKRSELLDLVQNAVNTNNWTQLLLVVWELHDRDVETKSLEVEFYGGTAKIEETDGIGE